MRRPARSARLAPGWAPVLAGADAATALAVAAEIGRRLRDPAGVEARLDEARLRYWRPEGLWQGFAGLALLSGALDAVGPGDGWDRVGREQLRRAGAGAERLAAPGPGLTHGLGGLAMAAWALSRDGTRYEGFRATLEPALAAAATAAATAVLTARPHGVAAGTFDVISGLTGAGRHLLARRDEPALEAVLRALVHLSEEDGHGVPHWHTDPANLTESFLTGTYPHGHVNLGLAHGVAGPLALLSLATTEGIEVEGQRDAIARTARWITAAVLEDRWGPNVPAAVALGPSAPPPGPARAAWCYGAPGVARSLWLAGTAIEDPALHDLAVALLLAVHRRPPVVRHIDSPTVCHGVAGLLQITLRFAHATGRPDLDDAARALTGPLLDAYEPDTAFGYRNLDPDGSRFEHPGLLDGAAGVALVLAAAASEVEPTWDRALILS